jgi:hypothetical protein
MNNTFFVVFALASVLFALAVTATLGYLSSSIRKLEANQTVDLENPPVDSEREYTAQQQMFTQMFPGRTIDTPLTEFPKPQSSKKSGAGPAVTNTIFT